MSFPLVGKLSGKPEGLRIPNAFGTMTENDSNVVLLLTRQLNIASRHPRLSGIGRRNKLNLKKDSGQAGMTELGYLLAGVIITASVLHCYSIPFIL
jgi:hypothetical protein